MSKDIKFRIENKAIRRINKCTGERAGLFQADRKIIAKICERLQISEIRSREKIYWVEYQDKVQ